MVRDERPPKLLERRAKAKTTRALGKDPQMMAARAKEGKMTAKSHGKRRKIREDGATI